MLVGGFDCCGCCLEVVILVWREVGIVVVVVPSGLCLCRRCEDCGFLQVL